VAQIMVEVVEVVGLVVAVVLIEYQEQVDPDMHSMNHLTNHKTLFSINHII
jgi:type III secretory pathway component EscU